MGSEDGEVDSELFAVILELKRASTAAFGDEGAGFAFERQILPFA